MSWFVADPLLIHIFVNSRENSHQLWASIVHLNTRLNTSFKHITSVIGLKFPRSCIEGIRLVSECAYWTQIHDIGRELGRCKLFNISADLGIFPSSCGTESIISCYQLSKANASGAMDASIHDSLDKWSYFFILDSSLVLHKPSLSITVNLRDIL